MALTKELGVTKVMIEELLRRKFNAAEYNLENARVGLKLLSAMIDKHKLYVVSDVGRLARDFGLAIGRPVYHIYSREHVQGLENIDVIVLHTGSRTIVQQRQFDEIMEQLAVLRDCTFYHVGEWR